MTFWLPPDSLCEKKKGICLEGCRVSMAYLPVYWLDAFDNMLAGHLWALWGAHCLLYLWKSFLSCEWDMLKVASPILWARSGERALGYTSVRCFHLYVGRINSIFIQHWTCPGIMSASEVNAKVEVEQERVSSIRGKNTSVVLDWAPSTGVNDVMLC